MPGPREGSFLETLCFMNQLPSFRFVKLTPPESLAKPQQPNTDKDEALEKPVSLALRSLRLEDL